MNPALSPSQTEIPAQTMISRGILEIPTQANCIILFAHCPDSNNLNPRNRLVARSLLDRGMAIMLPDLGDDGGDLQDDRAATDHHDILQTANRLTAIIDWLDQNPATGKLRIGLFGGRNSAAAAMIAAARLPEKVRSLVSRGGRPDLADDLLSQVFAPTLMIVGGNDSVHIDHNRKAVDRMPARPMLELIHGATHLFGEPGKLEQVASITCVWFHRTLAKCG